MKIKVNKNKQPFEKTLLLWKKNQNKVLSSYSYDLELIKNFAIIINNIIYSLMQVKSSIKSIDIKKTAQDKDVDIDKKTNDILNLLQHRAYFIDSVLRIGKDFNDYISAAITYASQGGIKLSYTLIRRPIEDNLLYLEWLLINPEEFLDIFLNGNMDDIDLNYNKKHKDNVKRKFIVKEAYKIVDIPNTLFTNINSNENDWEYLYNLRYNVNTEYSLERIWNKALHLITSHKLYRSDNGELNFVFEDLTTIDEHTKYFCGKLIYLLFYAISLLEKLVSKINNISNEFFKFNSFIRKILVLRNISKNNKLSINNYIQLVNELKIYLPNETIISCWKCKKEMKLTEEKIKSIYRKTLFECEHCKEKYYLDILYLG